MQRFVLPGALTLGVLCGCWGEDSADSTADATRSQALTCTNLVPVMTSATAPSGIASASGVFNASSLYSAWKAFDGNYSFWLSAEGQTPAWLAYQFSDGPKTVHRYAITYSNGSIVTRAPMNWTLEGWNGAAWVVVDTRTQQTGWSSPLRREFNVASPGAYVKYRLNVTDDNDTRTGNVVISIGALELLSCAGPVTVWTRTSGATGGITQSYDLTGLPSGRTYLTGFTNVGLEGVPGTGGFTDGFLTARDANGGVLWSRQMGSPTSAVWPFAVATTPTSGHVLAAGIVQGPLDGATEMGEREAFVTQYNDAGVRQWTRLLGTSSGNVEAYGVAVDGSDNVFIGGSTTGNVDGNVRAGLHDAFVSKHDAAGNRLWTRTVGMSGARTESRRVATDSAGNVYVSGWTTGALDGNTLNSNSDVFVTKFNGNGVKQWTRQAGTSTGGAYNYDTTTDAEGNVYLAGGSPGGMDGVSNGVSPTSPFVVKYSPSGVKLWVWELSSGSGAAASGIFASADGLYVSGSGSADVSRSDDTRGGATHSFVARLDFSGNLMWVVQQPPASKNGVPIDVQVYGLSVDSAGSPYLGGFLYGDFDGNTLKGSPDAFVTKLAPR
ncbi:SBBP repeat-containing protein [Myxococcus stipitatus]|uniref:SBBP repeat-containing protein n=1 Tax=Myxococcus stipitatus TaxID=83455 RepID=UPI003144E3B5